MQLDKIIKLLPGYLAAGISVEIKGRSGIGKTDMIKEFVDNMNRKEGGWGRSTHFGATWTPSDVTGYLMPRTIKRPGPDGTPVDALISEWAAPVWLRADPGQEFEWLNDFRRGILILEEYDKINPEVKKAAAPLVLERGLQGHYLHAGIGVVLLSNPADDGRQGSTKEQDFVINRKITLNATQSVKAWEDWAPSAGINPIFVAFATSHVEAVFGGVLPEKQGPFCTPRSLVALAKVASAAGLIDNDGHILDDEGFTETAQGAVGGPATRDLVTFLKFKDDVPDWAEIVAKPGSAKVPENVGGQLMVAHVCAFNVDDKTVEPAVTYVRRLKKEFHITFAKAATRRNFRLTNSKPFVKWTSESPELVALITALGGAR